MRSTVEVILVTGMVISILHTLFTDSLLALAPIKVLVADFQTLLQSCYFRQQITDQLFIIVQFLFRSHGSLLQGQQFVNLGQQRVYARLVTTDTFGIPLTGSHKLHDHFRFLVGGHI